MANTEIPTTSLRQCAKLNWKRCGNSLRQFLLLLGPFSPLAAILSMASGSERQGSGVTPCCMHMHATALEFNWPSDGSFLLWFRPRRQRYHAKNQSKPPTQTETFRWSRHKPMCSHVRAKMCHRSDASQRHVFPMFFAISMLPIFVVSSNLI